MLNFFFGFMALTSLLMTFSLTYSIGGIHRTFLSLSRGVLETAVSPLVNAQGNYVLYYEPSLLEYRVNEYLIRELADYTDNYLIGFYYYEVLSQTPCSSRCGGVQIHLIVEINVWVTYDDALRFELRARGT